MYKRQIRFYDINYQLAQNEDKNAIFENWCDFLNYFDSSIHFQLSFINHKSSMKEFEQVIKISPQGDAYDDIRMEYANMLKKQLARGNNGLVKTCLLYTSWLPPATLLWTCHLGTPCNASCSQPTSFIKYAIFSISNKV